jgi:hypothetical protein
MQFLLKPTEKKTAAHIWTSDDTLCRMASTGGLDPQRYKVAIDFGDHKICHMCEVAFAGLSKSKQEMLLSEWSNLSVEIWKEQRGGRCSLCHAELAAAELLYGMFKLTGNGEEFLTVRFMKEASALAGIKLAVELALMIYLGHCFLITKRGRIWNAWR